MISIKFTDSDLEKKTRKTAEKLTENLYVLANEPTLASYRIQEHISKSGPNLIEKKAEMNKVQLQLQDAFYGLEYSIKSIRSMPKAQNHLKNLQELLKTAVFTKQQIDYDESVRNRVAASSSNTAATRRTSEHGKGTKKSAFQRFSGSFDIPSIFGTSFGLANSTSADLKNVISQLASSSSSSSSSPQQSSLAKKKDEHQNEK